MSNPFRELGLWLFRRAGALFAVLLSWSVFSGGWSSWSVLLVLVALLRALIGAEHRGRLRLIGRALVAILLGRGVLSGGWSSGGVLLVLVALLRAIGARDLCGRLRVFRRAGALFAVLFSRFGGEGSNGSKG